MSWWESTSSGRAGHPGGGVHRILDADKEGFLRDEKSTVQTIGRASRNANSQVVLYADRMTGSIKKAMETTEEAQELCRWPITKSTA